MTTMNIWQVNAHSNMQCNEDQSQWSIACPTLNQYKIHEVFASRIQSPTKATRVRYSRHIGNILKVQKDATKQ